MIKDLKDFIDGEEMQPTEECDNTKACVKMARKLLQDYPEKWNPLKNTPYKDNLDHTPRRKEKYKNFK